MLTSVYSNRQTPYLTGQYQEIRTTISAIQNLPATGPATAIVWASPTVDTIDTVRLNGPDLEFSSTGLYYIGVMLETTPTSGAGISFTSQIEIEKYDVGSVSPYLLAKDAQSYDHTTTNGNVQYQSVGVIVYASNTELVRMKASGKDSNVAISLGLTSFLRVVKIA